MSALPQPEQHRVTDLARRLREELGMVAGAPLWSMSADDAGAALVLLTQARSQLDELLMRVLRQAQSVEVGAEVGATTPSWWAHQTATTRAEAHRTTRLAADLEEHDQVATSLAAGAIRTDQAQVIVSAVDALPDDVAAWVPEAATTFLLDKAAEHDAKALRVIGRRVLEVIDPEAADAEEARRLEAEESEALAAASFTMSDDGAGRAHGRFTIPTLHAEMLRKHLLAIAFSQRPTTGPDGARTTQQLSRHRLGLAFVDYLESRPETTVPSAGGVTATVVVTMDLATLEGGIRAASLDTGARISASEARRIACRAGIIPVVLGGPSVVLDAGRKRRFHSETQRIVMGIRDGGCCVVGCDTPPGLTRAHHAVRFWSEGGGTSVDQGRLYCPRHHRIEHDPRYTSSADPHGKVRFTRRT